MSDFAEGFYGPKTSKKYPKVVAFWKTFFEYTKDYFSGHKHKLYLETKQKQK